MMISRHLKTDCSQNNFLNYFCPKYIYIFSVLLTSSFVFFLVVLLAVSVLKLTLP